MEFSIQTVGDLIRWGYQPLAVAGDTKRPVHQQWQVGSFSLDEILSSSPKRFGLRMGDQGLQAIDVDVKNSDNPKEFLDDFISAFRASGVPLNKVIIQSTLSGGVHLVYRTDNPLPSKKLAVGVDNRVLVETRGTKAFIVVYEPDKFSQLDSLELLTKEEENRLLSISLNFDKSKDSSDFKDFNNSNSCLDLLIAEGWTVVSENDRWYNVLRPGNSSATSSGKVFKDSNRAYIWSTSTTLPESKLLSPCDIVCQLRYGGNWGEFSRSLNEYPEWIQNDTTRPWNLFELSKPNLITQLPDSVLPKPLLGGLWQEDELCILFGPTNTGKSILAVEIANAISSGEGMFDGLLSTSSPRKVLYVDFEQSSGQFQIRYQGREFSDNLMRLIPNWDVADLKDFRRKVIQNMEEWSTKLEVEVLIVDNLSVVNPDNTQAADAAELVQSFRRLRSKLGISILLVGHTPKLPVGMRIEIQNLAGSAQMANLIDSCFALNKCGQGKVYIKQLKQRNDQQQFGAENVILGTIVKDPYVKFKLLGYAHEGELLSESGDISTRNERIISDYATGSHSQRKLAEMYKLSKSQINEILKKSVRPVNESGQSGQGGQIENDQFPF